MSLSPGTKLGPYEILSPLGAGGMGEVFRARDTRLGRDVAIKVLPQHLTAHAEVRARFEREARTVSSLNHPNICTLFDVGREGDTDYLVMELIEGETLAARLDKGPLPAADALHIGSQVADALDRAHRAGIVHRDLKPGNIMLTRTGAKLMDFGLARVTGLSGAPGGGVSIDALTQSPTMAHPLTAEGTIVGTFQYMSPEQLEGKEADERADIWALGCVLYEMATGKRPFDGNSQASLITSIMGSQPAPISQVAPMSPPALDHLVTACLAKDPADRVQSAHDVKLQLAWIAQRGSDIAAPKAMVKRRRNRTTLAWSLALIAALVAGALIRDATRKPAPAPVVRSALLPPTGVRLETTGDESGPPVISPDGSMVVFSAVGGGAGKRLWLRSLDTFEAHPLTGTDDASYPFWSPDSRSVGFFVPGAMRRIDVQQETVVTVTRLDANPRGGAWSKDGVIVYSRSYLGALYRVPATGGETTVASPFDSTRETTHRFPYFMPDGRHFIYISANHRDATGSSSAIYFASLDGGEAKRVLSSQSNAIYADGFLFFVQDSTLMAQEFDPASGETRGAPHATRETVQIDRSTWRMPASVADNGTLVYAAGGGTGNNRLSVFDRSGNVVKHLTEFGTILNIASSSDGRRIVYEQQVLPLADMWVVDRVSGTRSRITTHPDDETLPCFSPDDRYILYAGRHRGDHYQIYRMRADGSGNEELVLAADSADVWPVGESPDGRWLVYGRGVASGLQHGSIHVAPLPAGMPSRLLVPDLDNVVNASLSPDGRWLAYSAAVSGRLEIYVSPFHPESSGTPPRWQVSARGGECPRWRGDGREMYYSHADGTVVATAVDGSGADFRVDGEKSLFQVFQRPFIASICVTPDGQYFILNQLGGSSVTPLALVTNWTATLRQR